jgi:prepilin-type processing-associated H-X9-DG protein/prepilin-type N-terminal cleavage/methylation domain-containing protein
MKRTSFTLTELLVVISIMAILMAIIVPVLRNSRQQAKAVLCGSNIKQLTIGLFTYENQNLTLPFSLDNTPNTPPPGGYPGYGQYDRKGWWWFNFIEGFYKKSDMKITVVQCPSKWLTNPGLKNNILCGNYGVNRSICKSFDDRQSYREEFVGKPLSTNDIPKPAETLLIVDSGYAMISWWHAADEPPVVLGNTIIEDTAYVPGLKINKDRNLLPGQEQDAIYGRHPNKTVNVGFVDGHISRTKADDLLVEKTGDGYKNKSPLWVPK